MICDRRRNENVNMSATLYIGALLRPVIRRLVSAFALAACLLLSPAVFGAEELRTADQVRRLTPEQAERHLEVRLKAVVTFYDERLYSRFVQDETAGIYLQELTNGPALRPGQIVEIEGQTGAGEYAPIVIPRSVKVLGEGTLPTAKPVSLEQLVSGREDSQFVEVSGTVRKVYRLLAAIAGHKHGGIGRERDQSARRLLHAVQPAAAIVGLPLARAAPDGSGD
jgi:hypothetical protein